MSMVTASKGLHDIASTYSCSSTSRLSESTAFTDWCDLSAMAAKDLRMVGEGAAELNFQQMEQKYSHAKEIHNPECMPSFVLSRDLWPKDIQERVS